MNKEDKIKVMEHFIKRHTTKEIAQFIINLEETTKGLLNNMDSFQEEFRRLYKNQK